MDGSRIERDHLVRKAEGYWQLAAAMGEMVRDHVRWATVSWDGDVLGKDWSGGVRGDVVGDGSTLGVGGVSTLGGCTTFGGVNAVEVSDGGAREVLVFQWAKRSQRSEISNSFLVVNCGGGVLYSTG